MSALDHTRRDLIKNSLCVIGAGALAGCSVSTSQMLNNQQSIVPPALKKGDTIGFFSPSTPATTFAHKRFARAKDFLALQGFKLKAGSLTGQKDAYRSGTIAQRANELNELIRDPSVRCIMSTIGGMNSNALLPYIDYDALRRDPKIIIGYSDVTAILFGIYQQTGITTYYGPALVASFGEMGYFLEKTYAYFKQVVEQPTLPITINNPDYWTQEYVNWETQHSEKPRIENKLVTINTGKATGRLIVGNHNTLSGIFGTKYMPRIEVGDILLLEDSFQDAATVERSTAHLKLAGVFERIGGLIIGKHENYDDKGSNRPCYETMMEVIGDVDYPILAQYDCAHTHPMITLPLGANVTLDANKQLLTINYI